MAAICSWFDSDRKQSTCTRLQLQLTNPFWCIDAQQATRHAKGESDLTQYLLASLHEEEEEEEGFETRQKASFLT
jgi:hypothetical protein